ncbi:hypothetical protein RINTHH_14120 [Richelia intracellularis HH01]|uniref:Peptidase C14 caspase domain-containing protein n=1 Tax=Richelia intracellularis HH01 TaxID=1165094 RepID=M1WZG2_9NOST|nr:caspase family protein [Richelia intracellularis]CCH67567.1 hypothetical protein RINTHH_14120 [Richelia intracellularis HH01]
MKRRTFLQRFGPLVATMGLSQIELLSLGNCYYQALAQPSSRKFALLVGINEYSQNPPLGGCVADLELQRELLVHRFGFSSSNILTLKDEQASRGFIEDAFLEHLIKQAKPEDVVVFHFSGYGCQVEEQTTLPRSKNALVTVASTGEREDYLLENNLKLLVQSLATDKVTMVLDSSYYPPYTQFPSGWLIRACSSTVRATEEQTKLQVKLTEQLATRNILGSNSPPTVLTPNCDGKKVARELLFYGWSVGLFTYTLTQYLWGITPQTTVQFFLSQVTNSMYRLGNYQQPHALNAKTNQQHIADIFLTIQEIGAEGVIQSVKEDGETVNLWLGGIPAQLLSYYDVNSQFTLVGAPDKVNLVLRSPLTIWSDQFPTVLSAKAQARKGDVTFVIKPGQLIQEKIRVIPRNIGLTIALGAELDRIERVDATSALSTLNHVSSVIAGEQPADFVFGKLPLVKPPELDTNSSIINSCSRYGLFSMAGDLMPNTVGEQGEAVKIAVQRLTPNIYTLEAAKLWRLTENATSSQLAVKVNLEIVTGILPGIIIQQETRASTTTGSPIRKAVNTGSRQIPNVPIGSHIQYRIQNLTNHSIYVILLGLDTSMSAYILCQWGGIGNDGSGQDKPILENIVIAPGKSLIIPGFTADFQWAVTGQTSFAETQLILSKAPFKHTIEQQAVKYYSHVSNHQRIYPLLNPIEVTQALLEDLHDASCSVDDANSPSSFYSFDVNKWASFSFIYQIV